VGSKASICAGLTHYITIIFGVSNVAKIVKQFYSPFFMYFYFPINKQDMSPDDFESSGNIMEKDVEQRKVNRIKIKIYSLLLAKNALCLNHNGKKGWMIDDNYWRLINSKNIKIKIFLHF
jgi:hypothetical protein